MIIIVAMGLLTILLAAMKSGEYVGGRSPYGYLNAPDDCHRLIIDAYLCFHSSTISHNYDFGCRTNANIILDNLSKELYI